jgi:hypothetical protein
MDRVEAGPHLAERYEAVARPTTRHLSVDPPQRPARAEIALFRFCDFRRSLLGSLQRHPSGPSQCNHRASSRSASRASSIACTRAISLLRARISATERVSIGRYLDVSLRDARARANELRREVAAGRNPAEHKRGAGARTFATLADRYLVEHAMRFKRSADADERMLRKHVLPRWARRDYTMLFLLFDG